MSNRHLSIPRLSRLLCVGIFSLGLLSTAEASFCALSFGGNCGNTPGYSYATPSTPVVEARDIGTTKGLDSANEVAASPESQFLK